MKDSTQTTPDLRPVLIFIHIFQVVVMIGLAITCTWLRGDAALKKQEYEIQGQQLCFAYVLTNPHHDCWWWRFENGVYKPVKFTGVQDDR